ncbi:LysR family transcriptional regulator [Enterobacteriaceae bacterium EKM102V]|uniref:LysR family transcriptional regulator n=1 Tax=Pantoea TaxID=53335 RepID=UPI00142D1E86|nr:MULTISPECIES: LysR family transcriptional regulator [Pantoea]KAF6660299.1 LysR family transcriptional regulator [Enterobacteriaceae bacterium EKM102V]KAF6669862.1 LysR family transcriptional regulator [Pantoea sp. EKM103V]
MNTMHQELRSIDMNLLLVFDSIYRHRRITLAAGELALSPSALSHALSRLRIALNDSLFIRQGSEMQPTARAQAIASGLSAALNAMSDSLRTADVFKPETSNQTFRFAVTDYTAAVFFPALITLLQKKAPNVSVKTFYSTHHDSLNELLAGKVDFAIGFQAPGMRHHSQTGVIEGFTDDYVVAVNSKHPRIKSRLTLDHFLAEGHIVVNPWNEVRGVIDQELAKMNIKRRIVVELPSLLSAPAIVTHSGLITTLPERAIKTLFCSQSFNCFPVPFSVSPYRLNAYFHHGRSVTPGHHWMKDVIYEVMNDLARQQLNESLPLVQAKKN